MAKWIEDPQGREEIEKVTEELKLPIWHSWYKGKFREFWHECWEKIEDKYLSLKTLTNGKVSKSGDTMTGNLEMTGTSIFIGAYNYGYALRKKDGEAVHLAYYGEDGKINIGFGGTPINFRDDKVSIANNSIWHEGNLTPSEFQNKSEIETRFIANETRNSDDYAVQGLSQHYQSALSFEGDGHGAKQILDINYNYAWKNQMAFDYNGNAWIRGRDNNKGRWSKWNKVAFNSDCPYEIGDIYITTTSKNPATQWVGTTWEKIEGRFLRATSSSQNAGQTGGSDSKTLTTNELPSHSHSATASREGNHTHTQSPHSHTQSPHTHDIFYDFATSPGNTKAGLKIDWGDQYGWGHSAKYIKASGGDNTGKAQPNISSSGSHSHSISISSTGKGKAFDIKPSYYTVHIWKRLS